MTIAVYEKANSRSQTINPKAGSTVSLEYIALYSEDDSAIYTAVQSEAPATYGGLKKLAVKLAPQAGGVWFATVEYGTDDGDEQDITETAPDAPAGDDPLGAEFSFDTSGGTLHITQSKETVHAIKRDSVDAPPDYQRAIGVSKNGVAGVDIASPKLEFSITRNYSYVTLNYIQTLKNLTGKVNDATYLGFSAGELLFLGASGRTGSDGKKTITFKFAASQNLTDIEICDDLTVPTKKGHEYIWVAYEPVTNGGAVVSQPSAAYCERVYDEGDFTPLKTFLGA